MKRNWKIWLATAVFAVVPAVAQESKETVATNDTPRFLTSLREQSSLNVVIAAHRGGYENDKADQAPENSVANIQNCASKGYELFETDIQRTKDGVFVMVHDPTLERETTGAGMVSETSLAKLKELRKRYRDGSLSQRPVATLEEFLKEGHGRIAFKADMKPGVSKHFDEIMKLVVRLDALGEIIFRVPYEEADFYAQYRARGGLYAKHLFMFKVSSKKQIDDIKARFDSTTIQINLKKSNPTPEAVLDLIRYATAKGFVVETHAEGDEEDWGRLVEAGVHIFHTKAPSQIQKFLQTLPKEE